MTRTSDGTYVVQDDLDIVTFDLVDTPSVVDAVLLPVTYTLLMQDDARSARP